MVKRTLHQPTRAEIERSLRDLRTLWRPREPKKIPGARGRVAGASEIQIEEFHGSTIPGGGTP